MKQPLLSVALLFIAGVLGAGMAHPPLAVLFAASAAAAVAALAWERGRVWLLALLIFLTGWTDAAWHAAVLAPGDLRVAQGPETCQAGVRGIITAPPAQRIFELGGRQLWHGSALIEVSEMDRGGGWQTVLGKVIATANQPLSTNFFEGQSVQVHGVLRPLRGPLAEGLFDARAYYASLGVFHQLLTSGADDWAVPSGATAAMPLSERFRQWATRTLQLGLPPDDQAGRLTLTLLLDWKTPLTTAVEEPFMRAGTYHIFAVDGLRIGLLAGIGLGLLRGLRIPRAICGLMVIPALCFYAGLTGWPASAVRAVIMASALILGWACRRPGDMLNSLCAAALVILLWDPRQLYQPGFQLSFMVVLCIGLIVPPARRALHGWLFKGDPMLPDTLQPRLPPFLHNAAVYVVDLVAVSGAAWVGSIPLAAYYFHLFTPVSVPANCVVVPATALALTSGMASLLAGGWWTWLAVLFNNATWALMNFIIWFSTWAAGLPLANCNVASPSLGVILLYYAVLILTATGWIFRSLYKWTACAALLAAGAACLVHAAVERQTARLTILPLRSAPAVFADAPGMGAPLLLGCGSGSDSGEIVKPFLAAQGVNHLGALCIAVGLRPHFGGANVILTNFPPRKIFTGEAAERSTGYRELLETLRQTGRWETARDGDTIAGWTVLHPAAGERFAQADDNALALRRELGGHSVLLLPALGRDGQESLMRRHPELRAEIVLAGLPAREEPLCEPLLNLVQPRLIVIMDAARPATRRASTALRARLARCPARVAYECDNGALTLELARRNWSLRNAEGGPAVEGPPPEASGEAEAQGEDDDEEN